MLAKNQKKSLSILTSATINQSTLTMRDFKLYFTVFLGIDNIKFSKFKSLKGMEVGLCTNIASCNLNLEPTISIFQKTKNFKLKAIFATEHGIYGALQDQKKTDNFYDRTKRIMVYSLYNYKVVPDNEVLRKLDCLVIDLQDIGTRYYTFLWSSLLLIEQLARLKKKIVVLDRPNPLNGETIEGPVLDPKFSSFVGLYPIPVRHGLTIGELCNLINSEYRLDAEIEVVMMKGWHRHQYHNDTDLFWTMPSPNMPSFRTALVYPGMCLLEGTNISEGRGLTKPFEIFGAPWIDPFQLSTVLSTKKMPGVRFRPTFFIPTFNKYKNMLCGGIQIYVSNLKTFRPVFSGLLIIKTIRNLYADKFQWRKPPYEFERHRLPFDILIGNAWVREAIERNESMIKIEERWQAGLNEFKKIRNKYFLYD